MKRVLRVGYYRYFTDNEFDEHIAYLKEFRDAFDEITLFTDSDHNGYHEPEEARAFADVLRKRIPVYRSLGFKSVGINVLCTLGHLEEAYDVHERAPFPYVVNKDGVESRSCLCPSSRECLQYIYDRYSLFASCGADFIWIDDDVRMTNHGVVKADEYCYCDNCISRFNSITEESFTRDELVSKMTQPEIRSQYGKMQSDIILEVMSTIRKAIHDTDLTIRIGVMNDAVHFSSDDIIASGADMVRPGGGFYTDAYPIGVFDKNFRIQQANLKCPLNVKDVQYEYESFNFQSLEKSVQMTDLETTLAVMAGCNGSLYSMSWYYDRPNISERIALRGKTWNMLEKCTRGATYSGVYTLGSRTALYLLESGIPVTADKNNAVCAFVLGDEMSSLQHSEIESILALGLYTDGYGMEKLTEMGFGERLGGSVLRKYDNGMAERFAEHEMNGKYKGFFRNAFMNFPYTADAYEFSIDSDAVCLSNLETVTHKPHGPSLYLYESSRGHRIAIDGYMLPGKMKSKHKIEQLRYVFDYLSCGRVPVRIECEVKVVPTVTQASDGNLTVMLTNASLDPTGEIKCVVNTDKQLYVIEESGKLALLDSEVKDGKSTVKLENISPWSYVLLTTNN